MENRRYDLLSCDFCKKAFKEEEEAYEIAKVFFDPIDKVFDPVRAGLEDEFELPSVRRVIRFHQKCFEAIAGEAYAI